MFMKEGLHRGHQIGNRRRRQPGADDVCVGVGVERARRDSELKPLPREHEHGALVTSHARRARGDTEATTEERVGRIDDDDFVILLGR